MSFPDAVTRDLYYYEKAYAEAEPPRCLVCGKECAVVFTWRGSGAAIECDCRIDRHYTDDVGFEDFVCPNGCRLDPDHAESVYTWRGSGEPVGCRHCITAREAQPLEDDGGYWV
jgi:hypothetical protein